jgi:hypothetical protein
VTACVQNTWGSTPEERARPLPCDRFLPDASALHRAVDVDAPAPTVFRWLCQLRAAPYSYDWIDNFGRRSPQQLIAGLDDLATGQRFMTIFELVDFEPDRQITLLMRGGRRLFGDLAVTYLVEPRGPGRSRVLVRLRWRQPSPLHAAVMPWLDLVMMRRQLLNLGRLAEAPAPS